MDAINAGQFKHKFTLMENMKVTDEDNIIRYEAVEIYSTKCMINSNQAAEKQGSQGTYSNNSLQVTIRYPKGLNLDLFDTEKYQFSVNSFIFNVTKFENTEMTNKYLIIYGEFAK